MDWIAKWIAPAEPMGDVCPEFCRRFSCDGEISRAVLSVTAMGVYEARLNSGRVGNFVMAPGWTSYEFRHQYQQYDVTEMLRGENELCILVGKGWYRGPWGSIKPGQPAGLIAQLKIEYAGGRGEYILTDGSWRARESAVRFSELYNGERADARVTNAPEMPVKILEKGTDNLIPQEGEVVCEQERVKPRRIFSTPAGETVVDFGQEITGYVEFTVNARAGDEIEISHAEVLDKNGNFYNDNYRSAKAKLCYVCRDGEQTYKPRLTFFGFRYIRLDRFPGEPAVNDFTAILVCSDMQRTGYMRCGNAMINRLYENVLWGQRGNFLDVPTDCPQRDERLGWTGDAQVFVKTACYNYNVKKFFSKWLGDMAADQLPSGGIPHFIPAIGEKNSSAAWGDAAVIVPWQIYMSYGDSAVLARQFESMKGWAEYIAGATKDEYLWTGCKHFGDWLGLDAPAGSYTGSTREDFIASAFYANCADILARTCGALGKDPAEYIDLHEKIVSKFRRTFTEYTTQTEDVLALVFGLTEDPAATAAELADRITGAGTALQTGFVGTPYLLFALSQNGYTGLAYDLLLRTEYPSWLYPVTKGATTVWEHWDGIMEDGSFWSADMNSFNHYAYGSVMGWVYEEAAGIQPVEEAPGFEKVRIAPKPDKRLGWLEASVDSAYGRIFSGWYYENEGLRYEIHTPTPARVRLGEKEFDLEPGKYMFFE
ncbi:MAG: family 78 glycoside hydrolase catalytic domain [Clostridiales bacterium]|nr:family 78 glycoside hydrolase catalytic domain [Clostridiales bacterium]